MRTFSILAAALALSLCSCGGAKKTTVIDSEEVVTVIEETSVTGGNWHEDSYVDEFGAPTDHRFYMGYYDGSFSNSATTGSRLRVGLLVDADSTVRMQLFEYGDNLVKSQSNNMRIRIDNDSIVDDYIYMNSDGYGSFIKGIDGVFSDKEKMFLNAKKLEFSVTESSGYGSVPSTYRFTIEDASSILEAIKKLNN